MTVSLADVEAVAFDLLTALTHSWSLWEEREGVRGVAGTDKVRRQTAGLLDCLGRNEAALAPRAARRRCGQPIATSFVESAVDEIIAWRMTKKQKMRCNRATVQPFLDVRAAVLNDTFKHAFRRCYAGFRPANDDRGPTAASA